MITACFTSLPRYSSASAFSALSLCLTDIEKKISSSSDFIKKSSFISRLGSGSACRSVFGPASIWGKSNLVEGSSDDYAIPFELSNFFKKIIGLNYLEKRKYCKELANKADTIFIGDKRYKSCMKGD